MVLPPEQQKRYAKVCQTGLKEISDDLDWRNLKGYNKQFAQALKHTNDYCHLPEYPVLLKELQAEIYQAIAGKKTAQQALNDAAEKHERTLIKAGYEIPEPQTPPKSPTKSSPP